MAPQRPRAENPARRNNVTLGSTRVTRSTPAPGPRTRARGSALPPLPLPTQTRKRTPASRKNVSTRKASGSTAKNSSRATSLANGDRADQDDAESDKHMTNDVSTNDISSVLDSHDLSHLEVQVGNEPTAAPQESHGESDLEIHDDQLTVQDEKSEWDPKTNIEGEEPVMQSDPANEKSVQTEATGNEEVFSETVGGKQEGSGNEASNESDDNGATTRNLLRSSGGTVQHNAMTAPMKAPQGRKLRPSSVSEEELRPELGLPENANSPQPLTGEGKSHQLHNSTSSPKQPTTADSQEQGTVNSFGGSIATETCDVALDSGPEATTENLEPGPENLDSLTVNTHSESREVSGVQNEDAEMADAPPDNSNDVRVGPLQTPATLPHIEGLGQTTTMSQEIPISSTKQHNGAYMQIDIQKTPDVNYLGPSATPHSNGFNQITDVNTQTTVSQPTIQTQARSVSPAKKSEKPRKPAKRQPNNRTNPPCAACRKRKKGCTHNTTPAEPSPREQQPIRQIEASPSEYYGLVDSAPFPGASPSMSTTSLDSRAVAPEVFFPPRDHLVGAPAAPAYPFPMVSSYHADEESFPAMPRFDSDQQYSLPIDPELLAAPQYDRSTVSPSRNSPSIAMSGTNYTETASNGLYQYILPRPEHTAQKNSQPVENHGSDVSTLAAQNPNEQFAVSTVAMESIDPSLSTYVNGNSSDSLAAAISGASARNFQISHEPHKNESQPAAPTQMSLSQPLPTPVPSLKDGNSVAGPEEPMADASNTPTVPQKSTPAKKKSVTPKKPQKQNATPSASFARFDQVISHINNLVQAPSFNYTPGSSKRAVVDTSNKRQRTASASRESPRPESNPPTSITTAITPTLAPPQPPSRATSPSVQTTLTFLEAQKKPETGSASGAVNQLTPTTKDVELVDVPALDVALAKLPSFHPRIVNATKILRHVNATNWTTIDRTRSQVHVQAWAQLKLHFEDVSPIEDERAKYMSVFCELCTAYRSTSEIRNRLEQLMATNHAPNLPWVVPLHTKVKIYAKNFFNPMIKDAVRDDPLSHLIPGLVPYALPVVAIFYWIGHVPLESLTYENLIQRPEFCMIDLKDDMVAEARRGFENVVKRMIDKMDHDTTVEFLWKEYSVDDLWDDLVKEKYGLVNTEGNAVPGPFGKEDIEKWIETWRSSRINKSTV